MYARPPPTSRVCPTVKPRAVERGGRRICGSESRQSAGIVREGHCLNERALRIRRVRARRHSQLAKRADASRLTVRRIRRVDDHELSSIVELPASTPGQTPDGQTRRERNGRRAKENGGDGHTLNGSCICIGHEERAVQTDGRLRIGRRDGTYIADADGKAVAEGCATNLEKLVRVSDQKGNVGVRSVNGDCLRAGGQPRYRIGDERYAPPATVRAICSTVWP